MDYKSRGRQNYENKIRDSKKFHNIKKMRGMPSNNNRNKYVEIYQHTLDYCSRNEFEIEEAIKYLYNADNFTDEIILANRIKLENPATISVENMDSFEMAIDLTSEIFEDDPQRVFVLNMASDARPGGGVLRGMVAQEEDLFRRSNYHEATDNRLYDGRLGLSEVIYSPIVHIIKDTKYNLLEEPIPVSCLAVAALRNPVVTTDEDGNAKYAKPIDLEIMKEKINMIFKVAILHGHQYLVLGALGCGAFHNPAQQVANLFKEALVKYGFYFKKIGFAVMSNHPNDENFTIFSNILTNEN